MAGYIIHSAKGTTWSKKDHKYVKKEGDKYFYNIKNKLGWGARNLKRSLDEKKENAKDAFEEIGLEVRNTINYAYDDYQNYKKNKEKQKKREEIEATIAAGRDYVRELFDADYVNKKREKEARKTGEGYTVRRKGPGLKESLSNLANSIKKR